MLTKLEPGDLCYTKHPVQLDRSDHYIELDFQEESLTIMIFLGSVSSSGARRNWYYSSQVIGWRYDDEGEAVYPAPK